LFGSVLATALPLMALHQIANDANQIAPHGAANAAIVHFKNFFIGIDLQNTSRNHRGYLAAKREINAQSQ
jgi:hypothetical protein